MLPNVTDFPASRFNVRANASFSLSCDTNSLNNTITWHRDGSDSPLPSGGSSLFSVVRSGTLSILTVNTSSPLPNGAYQCRATLSTASVLSREVFVAIGRCAHTRTHTHTHTCTCTHTHTHIHTCTVHPHLYVIHTRAQAYTQTLVHSRN